MGVPINNVPRRAVYNPSGTGPYNFSFEILAATDIAVYRGSTLLTLTADYSVTINPNGTGYVTLVTAPAEQVAIIGNRTIQRTTDFVTGGDFFANSLNDELDQQTIFAQQNSESVARSLKAPEYDPASINMTLPAVGSRINKFLSFDASGNPTTSAGAPNTLYYGSAATDPTTRPDGTARVIGDLYYSSSVGVVRVFTAGGWVNLGGGTFNVFNTSATTGQTIITTDYTVGAVQVFINGVLLYNTEYTATNGTSITLGTAMSSGDEITVISFNQIAYAVPVTVSTSTPSGSATAGALWIRIF
jgi:hypothetical protein